MAAVRSLQSDPLALDFPRASEMETQDMTDARGDAEPTTNLDPRKANVSAEYEIETHTSLIDRPLRTLKHGDAFAVLDSYGDIGAAQGTAEGLFYRDTRYLSHYELRIEGKKPLLLSSTMHEDKAALSVDLTNPDVALAEDDQLPRDTIFLERTKFLWKAVCYERINIKNYDRVRRRLRLDAMRATFELEVAPGAHTSVFVSVACEEGEAAGGGDFFLAYRDARRARRASTAQIATVASSNGLFDEVACRATSDVYTLITRSDLGPYPYAGIPWFSTIFGRDGIITAMFLLWSDPTVARGVLRTLAATQASDFDASSDAQPGKILHERRHGEMANLGEVPFRRYYGTVDATPLFVMLAGMYFERTGDRTTLSEIWPSIEAALRWIDAHGDRDSDGFVEYYRETDSGLE